MSLSLFGIFDQDLTVCQSAKVFSQIWQKNKKNLFRFDELVSLLNDMQSTIKVFSAQSDLQSSKDRVGKFGKKL